MLLLVAGESVPKSFRCGGRNAGIGDFILTRPRLTPGARFVRERRTTKTRPLTRLDARCKIHRPPGARSSEHPIPRCCTRVRVHARDRLKNEDGRNTPVTPQRHRGTDAQRENGGRVGERVHRVSDSRSERQADDSAPCGRAGHDVSRPSIAVSVDWRLDLETSCRAPAGSA
jgi:hypothetical protein